EPVGNVGVGKDGELLLLRLTVQIAVDEERCESSPFVRVHDAAQQIAPVRRIECRSEVMTIDEILPAHRRCNGARVATAVDDDDLGDGWRSDSHRIEDRQVRELAEVPGKWLL